MGNLLENKLTDLLIDTMEDFPKTKLLKRLLEQIDISLSKSELESAEYSNFEVFQLDDSEEIKKREVDGLIVCDSTIIFIEAKRGSNKHEIEQLKDEYLIGSKIAKKTKKDFYLIAIDENITEPKVIDTLRNSAYAKVKREQIKWISWHEITKILKQIFETYKFDGEISRNIFEKRLKLYQKQGFKQFEKFENIDINTLSKLSAFIKSVESFNTELNVFIKTIQMDLQPSEIIKLYRKTKQKRTYGGKRKTISSIGSRKISDTRSGITVSATFPFADANWEYDLSKRDLDYYLFVKFDFEKKLTVVGYKILKSKNIKQVFTNVDDFLDTIRKNRTIHHKSMNIIANKHSEMVIDSAVLTSENLDDFKNSKEFILQYEFATNDEGIKEKVLSTLVKLRDVVRKLDLTPALLDMQNIEKLKMDESLSEEDAEE